MIGAARILGPASYTMTAIAPEQVAAILAACTPIYATGC